MLYEEFDPLPGSSPWVANHWRFTVEAHDPEAFEHVIVPDGALSVSVAVSGDGPMSPVVFAGPSTTAHRVTVQRGWTYVGVRLHPAACGPLLRIDAAASAGKIGLFGIWTHPSNLRRMMRLSVCSIGLCYQSASGRRCS